MAEDQKPNPDVDPAQDSASDPAQPARKDAGESTADAAKAPAEPAEQPQAASSTAAEAGTSQAASSQTPPAATSGSDQTEGEEEDDFAFPRPVPTAILLVVVLALLGVGYLILGFVASSSLDSSIESWKAEGGATKVEELATAEIPADQNAASLYREAFGKLPTLNEPQSYAMASPWQAKQSLLAEVAAAAEPSLSTARNATQRPNCRWDLDYSGPEAFQDSAIAILGPGQVLIQLLQAEAVHHYYEEDPEAMLTSLLTAFRVSRDLGNVDLLAHFLVQIQSDAMLMQAVRRLMGRYDVGRTELREALNQPQRSYRRRLVDVLDTEGTLAIAMSRREAFVDLVVQNLQAINQPVPWWYNEGTARLDVAYYLDRMREDRSTYGIVYYDQPGVFAEEKPWYALLSDATLPMQDPKLRLNEKVTSGEALKLLALTALNLRDYHAEHEAYPESLEALENEPIDPYTGQPVRYKQMGEGFALGSIGPGPGEEINWVWQQ